jgi:hypothetical protein
MACRRFGTAYRSHPQGSSGPRRMSWGFTYQTAKTLTESYFGSSGAQSGNACYHSVQNLLSSSLLSKNLKIKKYRTIILSVVLHGCETWSLTLREERRLRVLWRLFGPKRDEVTGEWRKLHNEGLNLLTPNDPYMGRTAPLPSKRCILHIY